MTVIDDAIAEAEAELGKPYVYGDDGPNGFDCSGLMQYAFAKVGIKLPRTADQQYRYAKAVTSPSPGDLVFYLDGTGKATHVALYIGNSKMIEAPHTGADVRIEPVYNLAGHTRAFGRIPGLGAAVAPVVGVVQAGFSTVADVATGWLGGAERIVFEGVFGILGLALVGYGVYRLTTTKGD